MISLFLALLLAADPAPRPIPLLVAPAPGTRPPPRVPRELMQPTAPPARETVQYATLLDVVAVPKQADFTALYPPEDPEQPAGAAISLDCAARPDGVLTDCRITNRVPVDARFGKATLAISAFYRLRPLTAAELKAWPADRQRRIRTSISWSRGASGVTGVPNLPLPDPGPPPLTSEGVVRKPWADWARRPDGDDLSRYYPEPAMRQAVEGSALITCQVTGEGLLELCVVETESPVEMGFGEATLRLARTFRMKPVSADGRPVEGSTVRLPVQWRIPQ